MEFLYSLFVFLFIVLVHLVVRSFTRLLPIHFFYRSRASLFNFFCSRTLPIILPTCLPLFYTPLYICAFHHDKQNDVDPIPPVRYWGALQYICPRNRWIERARRRHNQFQNLCLIALEKYPITSFLGEKYHLRSSYVRASLARL